MKLSKRIVTAIVLVFMIAVASIPSMAATLNRTIELKANKAWTSNIYAGSRDTSYSDRQGAKCHSVYPDSGLDFFSIIQCRLTNSRGQNIGVVPYIGLTEGESRYTRIAIAQGYLDETSMFFQFRGNTNSAANAVVSCKTNLGTNE